MKIESKYKCPYCGFTYKTEPGRNLFAHVLAHPDANVAVHAVILVCPHMDCGKAEVFVDAGAFPAALRGKTESERQEIRYDLPGTYFRGRLLPSFGGKPELRAAEVPEAIYKDYDEACRLLPVSAGACVTMARRCAQKMIRAKFRLKPGKFHNEIKTLGTLSPPVQQEIIDALDSIRKTGKFRALPDDEIRVVSDVSPEAA
ncbi:MAG: DUF4145 domain-containing protein, partial [Synergistaceae bacterium]|nr:DUF4145 domain-containing protein [Synergistaceae bacterium]